MSVPRPTLPPILNLVHVKESRFSFVASRNNLDPTRTLDFFIHEHAHHFLETTPRHHRFLPPLEVGVFGCIPIVVFHNPLNVCVPHHKGQVCIGAFVPDKPFLALQSTVQNANDAFQLIGISRLGGLELLGVEELKPIFLQSVYLCLDILEARGCECES